VPFDASIDYATNAGRVRLLINDTDVDPVFSDAEIASSSPSRAMTSSGRPRKRSTRSPTTRSSPRR
jgi:hypothetical protein